MSDTLQVIPAAGLKVIDPDDMEPIPPEGKLVPDTLYWWRRLAEGDVTTAPPEAPPPPPNEVQDEEEQQQENPQ